MVVYVLLIWLLFVFMSWTLNLNVSSNVDFSATGGKLVDPTPDIERELAAELEKVAKQYGGGEGVDMTQFPTFKFKGK
jgi:F-type H+-transporting ATPase subunit 6